MTDILIRGVAADSVARIDAEAAKLGLSRNEYLRRRIDEGVRPGDDQVTTMEDLRRMTEAVADLADPDVMSQAWR